MVQRLRGRATAAVAAGLAATCIGVAAAPAFADTVRNQEWWLTSLHVTKAWLSSRGAGVKVAVLDTGVDTTQPDLAGSVITGRDYTASGRTAGGPFWGARGTALASIIAGHGHGPHHGDGMMGVAPQARILSVRVALESKDPLLANAAVIAALPQAIARGINYAVRRGAQVIDLPLDPAAQAGGTTTGGSPAERAAVEAALRKGVVLVAPSGDNGAGADTVNYPAAYPGVISVGAFGRGFVKAPFTNHQPYATLTAAGNGDIAANGPASYGKLKSTSAASAVVAGIAALIRSQFPTLTPAQVEKALTSSTAFHHPGGHKDGSGSGTADAAAALLAAATINATPTSSASPGSAGNPTPPVAPKVKLHTRSLWQAVRIPVLGLAALVLLALIILISVRVRQRRALDARLAPLQAAARASRGQAPASMTGMGSPGPGYGPPAGAGSRAPASSEPAGSGPANFGLAGPALAGQRTAGPESAGSAYAGSGYGGSAYGGSANGGPAYGGPDLAGPGFAETGSAGAAPAGSGLAGSGLAGGGTAGGRPGSGSVARPVVSGRPPWEDEDMRPPAPAPAPSAPEPARPGGGFLLPGRGLGSLDASGGRHANGGPGSGPGAGRPRASDPEMSDPSGGGAPEGTRSLNLGGWSLGKPSGGAAQGGSGQAGAGQEGAAQGGSGQAGAGQEGAGQAGARNGASAERNGNAGHAVPGNGTTGHTTSGHTTSGNGIPGGGAAGHGNPGQGSAAPLSGLGGTTSNGAAAAARARFGPSPFDDPSFGMSSFSPPATEDPSSDDRAFGAPAGSSTPGLPTQGPLGTPDPLGPRTPGGSAAGVPAPGSGADAGPPSPPAGPAGWRGPGRHGATRGVPGVSSPGPGRADSDGPALHPPGEAPVPPARMLGSAHRLNALRTPRTSSQPPWEPAEKPASELPWMDAPGSAQSRVVPPRRVFPVDSEGPVTGAAPGGLGSGATSTGRPVGGRSADPEPPSMTASGLVRRQPNSRSPFPPLEGPPAVTAGQPGSDSGGDENESAARPVYSWNPSDSTEAFPKLPPPGDSHPG